jgi:hypothetical protein
MGLLDSAKKAMGMGEAKKVNTPKRTTTKSAKDIATEKDEPWVSVIDLEVDPENPGSGAFELDWNPQFIKMLFKAGYRDDVEEDMVDRWFQDVCRQVVMETYEKDQAMVTRNDLGDGKAEYK